MIDDYAVTLSVRHKDYTTVVLEGQNRYTNRTAWGLDFLPFTVNGFLSSRSGGQSEIAMRLPLTNQFHQLVEQALVSSHLFELHLYRVEPTYQGDPPTSKTLVARYLGQVISASYSVGEIALGLGSTLDPVEASAPPRTFTTKLIGQPPKL